MVLRHLIVLTHGLGAMPFYMNGISDVLHAKFGALREDADAGKLAGADDAAPTMVALRVRNTSGIGETLDGIDMAGRRVFAEVQAFCERHPTIDRISFVGHSMGGIINRYTVGVAESAGFFDKVEPVAFISLASPHLGSRRPRTNVFDSLVNFVGSSGLSDSLTQLMLADEGHGSVGAPPLLAQMADGKGDFCRGLARFRHRVAYTNTYNDGRVNCSTGAIVGRNPFKHVPIGATRPLDAAFPSIIGLAMPDLSCTLGIDSQAVDAELANDEEHQVAVDADISLTIDLDGTGEAEDEVRHVKEAVGEAAGKDAGTDVEEDGDGDIAGDIGDGDIAGDIAGDVAGDAALPAKVAPRASVSGSDIAEADVTDGDIGGDEEDEPPGVSESAPASNETASTLSKFVREPQAYWQGQEEETRRRLSSMLRDLDALGWTRVFVAFDSLRAHNLINYAPGIPWILPAAGRDVIEHMCQFLE